MDEKDLEKSLGHELIRVRLDLSQDALDALGECIFIIKANDTRAGELAWFLWTRMTSEEKEKTNLHRIKWGSTIFLIPGLSFQIVSSLMKVPCNQDINNDINVENFEKALADGDVKTILTSQLNTEKEDNIETEI